MSQFVFGTHNAAFVQWMYEQYLRDPASVAADWRALFDNGHAGELPLIRAERTAAVGTSGPPPPQTPSAPVAVPPAPPLAPVASVSALPPPILIPITGSAARRVEELADSLALPTATSIRDIDVAILTARRDALNRALAPQGLKVGYTPLIAFAVIQALRRHPMMAHTFRDVDGRPYRVHPQTVQLGVAVDVEQPDGTHALAVPVLRRAEAMTFAELRTAYEALLARARAGALTAPELEDATITLTNPGAVGTVASLPRLAPGHGSIIASGAVQRRGPGAAMTFTSTYDTRIIQGAESGAFLRDVDGLLQGEQAFYERVSESLGVPVVRAEAASVAPAALAPEPAAETAHHIAAAMALVRAIRHFGHLAAQLDPLGAPPPGDPALAPEPLGLTPEVMAGVPAEVLRIYVPGHTLADAYPELLHTYCNTIAYEVEHIGSHEERVWLRQVIESGEHRTRLTAAEQVRLLSRLTAVETLEHFLQRTYLGQTRFSIEGLDAVVPMLDLAVELAAAGGARRVVLGMAHRGRLNVLAHVVGLPYETIFAEFEGGRHVEETLTPDGGTGDVKYHHGADGVYQASGGRAVNVTLVPNPSHLEAVNPVVEGRARAGQTNRRSKDAFVDTTVAVPLLLHGDASFAGQGGVAETFNLARLGGYRTGGTIHLITNNQLGFTTDPDEGRSTHYASDLAKGFDVPIVHVNADDPEACLAAVRLAFMYRSRFHGDIVIDVVGYRRHGHNEGDEPSYTQPAMYARIRETPPVRHRYAEQLVAAGVLAPGAADAEAERAYERLRGIQQTLKAHLSVETRGEEPKRMSGPHQRAQEPDTRTALSLLTALDAQLFAVPEGFTVNPKLAKQLERRREALARGEVDWAHAEALAFASLLHEGVPIRLTGQDTERGTFSQRHLVLHDANTGARYAPLRSLAGARAPFELHNSPLSEFASLGFEYGYAVAAPDALVLWEAQYGDFANAAEVIIDQFLIAGLAKWGLTSRLTLLLPHGYEGQGPEHSSARIERFLALSADGNLRVANCSTAAQYFHLLRRQARHPEMRPLVLFTPKSLLRVPQAASRPEELANGAFRPVLDDADATARRDAVRRLVLCTGKVYYDLVLSERRAGAPHVAVARVELLYPFPALELVDLVGRYPALEEIVWVQEEPRNMGPQKFMLPQLRALVAAAMSLRDIGRPERSSPAEGYPAAHQEEQGRIIAAAFAE